MIIRILGNLLRLSMLSGWIVGLCSGQEKEMQKPTQTSMSSSAGEELYKQHCVVCHGNDLKGNGPFPEPYRMPPDLRPDYLVAAPRRQIPGSVCVKDVAQWGETPRARNRRDAGLGSGIRSKRRR
jgi:mono/diheme cytochrome c family protein